MDISAVKNFNICRSVYDSMIDAKLRGFVPCEEDDIPQTVPKNRKAFDGFVMESDPFEGLEASEEEMALENTMAQKIMQ